MAIEPTKEPKVFYLRTSKQRMTRSENAPPSSRDSSSSSSSNSTRSSAPWTQVILGALAHALQPVLLQDGCIHATQANSNILPCVPLPSTTTDKMVSDLSPAMSSILAYT